MEEKWIKENLIAISIIVSIFVFSEDVLSTHISAGDYAIYTFEAKKMRNIFFR